MNRLVFLTLALGAVGISLPGQAAETSLQLVIDIPGNAERKVMEYKCDDIPDLRDVAYLNASPNFLAIMEIDGDKLIMASTLSGSGVRYASGQYVWWTKGAEASLYDQTDGPDAEPVATCIEATDIP